MNKMYCAIAFILGAVAGSITTWQLTKTAYAQLAQEEIDSVKEELGMNASKFKGECGGPCEDQPSEPFHVDKPELKDYTAKLRQNGYTNYSNTPDVEDKKGKEPEDEYRPYVLKPDEFGEGDGIDYDKVSLTLYADGVVTDDTDMPLQDIQRSIGDALEHVGEYEESAVYVRNDKLRIDYEILQDLRTYAEVSGQKPPHIE